LRSQTGNWVDPPERAPTSGDVREDRLTQLYRSYGPVIFARCLRLLGDKPTAEDAAQETFLRVYRHLEKAPDSHEALMWIYRIATNYCLNEIRNRKGRAEPREVLPDRPVPSVEALLADRDLVVRLLARAEDETRSIVWLYHVDGIDQGEVARILGISRRTVVNRLAEFTANAHKFLARTAA
jgi:RNA polymerase sigma-70 factor (ECF subfamily)